MAIPPHTITVAAKEEEEEKVSQPKTRIVHVMAPEVVKIDPANFREVVQKLTGKHTGKKRKMARNDDGSNMEMAAEDEEVGEVHGKLVDLDLFVQGLIQCPTHPLDPPCTCTQTDLN